MKKKVVVLMLAMSLMVAITACGDTETSSHSSKRSDKDKTSEERSEEDNDETEEDDHEESAKTQEDNSEDKGENAEAENDGDRNEIEDKLKLRDGDKLYTDGSNYLVYNEDEFGYCTIRIYTEDYELNGTYNGESAGEDKFIREFVVGYFVTAEVEYTHNRVGGSDMYFTGGNDPLFGYDVSDSKIDFLFADYKEGNYEGSRYMYYDIHKKTYTRVSTFEN